MTLGELVGLGVPALAGAAAYALGFAERELWLSVIAAGFGEGAVLGLAQWLALRRYVPAVSGRAWVLATALAAGLAWVLGRTISELLTPETFASGTWVAPVALLGVVFVLTMGGAQRLVLRSTCRSRAGGSPPTPWPGPWAWPSRWWAWPWCLTAPRRWRWARPASRRDCSWAWWSAPLPAPSWPG